MKHQLLILLLSIILPSTVLGQKFYKEYGRPGVNEGGTVMLPSPDGNLFVGGYVRDSAMVMKIDAAGNVLWTRTFKPSTFPEDAVFHIEITPDNFLIGNGNGIGGSPVTSRQGFIFKMDLNGNLQWIRCEAIASDMPFVRLVAKSSQEYNLVLAKYEVANRYSDIKVAYIDALTGNISFQSNLYDYSFSYYDDAYNAVMGKGEAMYTTHRIYVKGTAADGMRPTITKFGKTGNVEWIKYFLNNSTDNARLYNIDIAYENDSLISCYMGDRFGGSANFTMGLIRNDTLGNVIWSKDYNITSAATEYVRNLLVTSYGYVLTGHYPGTSNDLFMIATDKRGNVLWAKSYGGASSEETSAVSKHAAAVGGMIYLTGRTNASGTFNVFVASVDSLGNASCIPSTNLSVTQSGNPTLSTTVTHTNVPLTVTTQAPPTTLINTPIVDPCDQYSISLGKDTTLCGNYQLNATTPGALGYLWQDGSTSPTFNVTGTGVYLVKVTVNCCIRTDTVRVTISSASSSFVNASICAGDTFFIGTNRYTQSGNYIHTIPSSSGCDSIVTLALTVKPPSSSSISASICNGETFTLNNTSYTQAGSYTQILNSSSGCDSVITLDLSLEPQPSSSLNALICFGETYTLNNIQYTQAGTYTQFVPSSSPGCDSMITLNLMVRPQSASNINASVCNGETYTLNNIQYTQPGTYVQTLTTATGCDSLVTLSLDVRPQASSIVSASICVSDTFYIGSTAYTQAGTYSQTLLSSTGCDSTVTLNLVAGIVNASRAASICQGNAYYFGDRFLTQPGTYSDTIRSISGCDTVVSLNLAVTLLSSNLGASICAGDSLYFNGDYLDAQGVYTDTLVNANGCDSVITLELAVSYMAGSHTASICGGESFSFNGTIYTDPGTYIDTLFYTAGCDSIITLTLIRGYTYGSLSTTLCMGDTLYIPGGDFYTIAGSYTDTLATVSGCDSILTVSLAYSGTDAGADSCAGVCKGNQVTLNATGGIIYSWAPVSGLSDASASSPVASPAVTTTYTVTITDANSCVIEDTVTVAVDPGGVPEPAFTAEFREQECSIRKYDLKNLSSGATAYSWSFGDGFTDTTASPSHIYDQPAQYTITLTAYSSFGCSASTSGTLEVDRVFNGFWIPNAFTPNGDGLNDVFSVESYCFKEIYVEIFDRWGIFLHSWTSSDGTPGNWDGTFNGAIVQNDVYAYKLVATEHSGRKYTKYGHVTKLE